MVRKFLKTLILGITLFKTVVAMEASMGYQTISLDDIQVLHYPVPDAKALILWVHGGPFEDPVSQALAIRQTFFNDLNAQGYEVVAPVIEKSKTSEDVKEYKKSLNRIAQWIKETYPGKEVILMSHSKGGHWAGQTLREPTSPLRQIIKKWVFLSGTSHQGASALRLFPLLMNGAFEGFNPDYVKDIPMDQDHTILWEKATPLKSSEVNLTIARSVIAYKNWKLYQQTMVLPLMGIEDFDNPDLLSPLLFPKDIVDLSLSFHAAELPHIPTLIINPLLDHAVTVDTSMDFFQQLRVSNGNVFFYSDGSGNHNWMSNSQIANDRTAYNLYLGKMMAFIENPLDKSHEANTHLSLKLVSNHLMAHPLLDYVTKYTDFLSNKETVFAPFGNNAMQKIALQTLPVAKLDGLQQTKERIHLFETLLKVNKEALDTF